MLSTDSFAIRFDVLSNARRSASKVGADDRCDCKGVTTIKTRHHWEQQCNGRRPSQFDERTRNVLDATQALEAVASHLVEALVNVLGEETPSGGKGCSFKEFYKHPFSNV